MLDFSHHALVIWKMCRFTNVDIFHIILKIICINITNNLTRKLSAPYLKYWKAVKFITAYKRFPKVSLFFLKSPKFYHW